MSVLRAKAGQLLIALVALMACRYSFADPSFTSGIQTGTIQNAAITEASGIAASRMNPNVLWTQQDSGNPAQIFAMTPAGTNLGTYTLSGAGNTDWEDIAVGPGPTAGVQYVYVGDTGDNPPANRSSIAVYRVQEPVVSDTQSAVTDTLTGVSKFTFTYPDGPHDAESMFVDPLTKDIYIITKQINPSVYRASYPQSNGTLSLVATVTNPNPPTAADMSPDGSEIIVRGYPTTSGLLYQRPSGGTVADAFATPPISIPLLDEGFQGEAIGFDPQGRGYYTTREGASRPIYYFSRLPLPAEKMYWDNDGTEAGTYLATGSGLGGTGTWDTSSQKWYGGSADVAWVDANDAIFWGVAGTVTLSAAKSVNNLTFKSNGYAITGSTLTLTGATVTVDSGVTATIGSIVAGSAGIVKNGAGTLYLTNSNNQTSGYTGGTTINAGTLNIASGTVGHSGGAVTINNGSTLQFTGNFTLAAAVASVTLGSVGGVVDTNGNIDTIAGPISGTSLTKTGSGSLSLTGANTYTGTTTVSAGTLLVMNTSGSDTGTGGVIVNSGAVLGGTGTIQGNVTNSGIVAPGSGAGTLHVGGTFLQNSGGNLAIELASVGSHDELAVTGTGTLAGTLTVSLVSGFAPHEDDAFEIVSAAGLAGTFTSASLPGLTGNLVWNIAYGANAVTLSVVLPGDFNHSGIVDAADYVLWRKGVGTPSDYDTWRAHMGQTASPSGAALPWPPCRNRLRGCC